MRKEDAQRKSLVAEIFEAIPSPTFELNHQVHPLDLFVVLELLRRPLVPDPPVVDDVGPVDQTQR
jgi:hypothetical protein